MRYAILASAVMALACDAGDVEFQPPAVDVTGVWVGSVTNTVTTSDAQMVSSASAWMLLEQNGAEVTGRYMTDGGPTLVTAGTSGAVTGTVSGRRLRFALAIDTPGCVGTATGTADISGGEMALELGGESCGARSASGVLVHEGQSAVH